MRWYASNLKSELIWRTILSIFRFALDFIILNRPPSPLIYSTLSFWKLHLSHHYLLIIAGAEYGVVLQCVCGQTDSEGSQGGTRIRIERYAHILPFFSFCSPLLFSSILFYSLFYSVLFFPAFLYSFLLCCMLHHEKGRGQGSGQINQPITWDLVSIWSQSNACIAHHLHIVSHSITTSLWLRFISFILIHLLHHLIGITKQHHHQSHHQMLTATETGTKKRNWSIGL